MNIRTSVLAGIAVIGGIGALLATNAESQVGVVKESVALQSANPGFSQSGNSNISGTARAGTLHGANLTVTAGAVVGKVLKSDANGNATWQDDSLKVPASFIGSIGPFEALIAARNTNTGAGVNALYGEISSTQPDARAIMGLAQGGATGVFGISNTGVGVLGQSGPSGKAGQFDGNVQVNGRTSIGTTSTGGQLNVSANNSTGVYAMSDKDAVYGISTSTANYAGGNFLSSSAFGFGVYAANTNTTGGLGLYSSTSAANGIGIRALNEAGGLAGQFDGRVGITGRTSIGTTATDSQLNVSANGVNGIRVIGSGGNPGIGLYATSPNYAVYGETTGNGNQAGGYFEASSPSAFGAVGINFGGGVGLVGATSAVSGIGVKGENLFGGLAGYFQGRLEVTGATSIGTNATNGLLTLVGSGADVLHITNSGAGRGMYLNSPNDTAIWANTTTGIAGIDARNGRTDGYGVIASNSHPTGTGIGIAGSAASANGWGLFAFGRSGASGTKSFRIDHPLDPANKFLYHYASESPEPINFYTGIVTTNAKGEAWVTLPDYFESINRDFRYTLTVVDDTDSDEFVLAKVAKKIQSNRFKIRTSVGNVEVSWRIDAVRNDRFVQEYGAPVEQEKPENMKGRYQHPELYELGPESGMLPRQNVSEKPKK